MDNQGYLTVEVPVLELALDECLASNAISHARQKSILCDNTQICLVIDLGIIIYDIPATNTESPEHFECRAILLLFTHAPGRYHVIGVVNKSVWDWTKAIRKSVKIGGPEPIVTD
jgi:hypothetical protein